MALKKSSGNMYPWVTHTHSHLLGACIHACPYCYVQAMASRYPGLKLRYSGEPRLDKDELELSYGEGKTIFVEHMSDLFAKDVDSKDISKVLAHCARYPRNRYVFQTKNPKRYRTFLSEMDPGYILGTTIETNRDLGMGNAPHAYERYTEMVYIRKHTPHPIFVTVEPILAFDLDVLSSWIGELKPDFINVGADSKGILGLSEPTKAQVMDLVRVLKDQHGVEVREKSNLARLLA